MLLKRQIRQVRQVQFDRKNLNVYCWIFFHNFSFRKHTKTNEFHIFSTFEIENVGQDQEGEKRGLRRSIANV